METKLTTQQAFDAMTDFLESCYQQTKSNQINSLLSDMDMRTWGNGNETADPALWDDWLECTNQKEYLTIQEAFDAMAQFISMRYACEPDEHIAALIQRMRTNPKNMALWHQWLNSVNNTPNKR